MASYRYVIDKNKNYYEVKILKNVNPNIEKVKRQCLVPRNRSKEISNNSKRTVYDYLLNNDFNLFVTLTFDKKKIERENAELVARKILNYLKNRRHRAEYDFKYLIVPEWHSNKKAIHFHGSFYIPNEILSDKKMFKFKGFSKGNTAMYVDRDILKKFGANELVVIYNQVEFVANYATKYMYKNGEKILPKAFYSSDGLKRSERVISKSWIFNPPDVVVPNFKSKFVKIYNVPIDNKQAVSSLEGLIDSKICYDGEIPLIGLAKECFGEEKVIVVENKENKKNKNMVSLERIKNNKLFLAYISLRYGRPIKFKDNSVYDLYSVMEYLECFKLTFSRFLDFYYHKIDNIDKKNNHKPRVLFSDYYKERYGDGL